MKHKTLFLLFMTSLIIFGCENQTVTDMLALTNKYSDTKAKHVSQYKRWLGLIDTAYRYHPFQIELGTCIKKGLAMQNGLRS